MESSIRGVAPPAAGEDSQGSSGDLNPSQNEELSDLTGSDLEEDMTWIEWFCGLKGNEMFVFVDEDFVRDDFNLTGLSTQVPYYDKALSLIVEGDLSDDSPSDSVSFAYIEKSAALLFGLIHARFILTTKGLGLLQQKVAAQAYAKNCPNALCDFAHLVPCALTDTPNLHTVKLFCARCNELYHPPRSSYLNNIDGAFFGTSVASLFFMAYPQMLPSKPPTAPLAGAGVSQRGSGTNSGEKETEGAAPAGRGDTGTSNSTPVYYIPKIFGFKVHPDSRKLIQEREEQNRKRQAMLAAAAPPVAAATAAAAELQQQPQESDKWYAPGAGGAPQQVESRGPAGAPAQGPVGPPRPARPSRA
ncbi:casein kinase II subunit beta [Cyclospora cayetanensis]|uniref:Casein kinase II subunit beta n=1 Tax=Cyclospora cayetanensis TaxID=88456 RepID=A0A6P6RYP5_9EIME|nr:casein kinase II subunit beta [Cyclospora cayetanensis]